MDQGRHVHELDRDGGRQQAVLGGAHRARGHPRRGAEHQQGAHPLAAGGRGCPPPGGRPRAAWPETAALRRSSQRASMGAAALSGDSGRAADVTRRARGGSPRSRTPAARQRTSCEAGGGHPRGELRRPGEAAHRGRQVRVCGAVAAEQPAEAGHDPVEPQLVEAAHPRRRRDLEDHHPPAGAHDPRHLGEPGSRSSTLRMPKATVAASKASSANGQRERVGGLEAHARPALPPSRGRARASARRSPRPPPRRRRSPGRRARTRGRRCRCRRPARGPRPPRPRRRPRPGASARRARPSSRGSAGRSGGRCGRTSPAPRRRGAGRSALTAPAAGSRSSPQRAMSRCSTPRWSSAFATMKSTRSSIERGRL